MKIEIDYLKTCLTNNSFHRDLVLVNKKMYFYLRIQISFQLFYLNFEKLVLIMNFDFITNLFIHLFHIKIDNFSECYRVMINFENNKFKLHKELKNQ